MVRITHARRVGVVNAMNGRTNVTGGGSNGSLGGVIPLEAPSNFTVTPDNGKCLLTWTDPKDKYADEIGEITDEGDQLVSQFAYTRVVRKQGSAPSSPNDGDLVTDSSTRNQYQSSAYVDDGLTNNTLYYYAAFTCNTDGVYSGAAVGSGTPKSYDPILANNTWEQINDVANEGIASSVWEIGDEIDITALDETLTMVILDFDHDTLSDGSGTAAITFGMKNLMKDKQTVFYYRGIIGANHQIRYDTSPYYEFINSQILPSVSSDIKSILKTVTKKSSMGTWYSDGQYWTLYSHDKFVNSVQLFAFAFPEVCNVYTTRFNDEIWENDGTLYPYFETSQNRIKQLANGTGNASQWILRTSYHSSSIGFAGTFCTMQVSTSGSVSTYSVEEDIRYYSGICFGFCVGKTPS